MSDFLMQYYLWLKALHVIAIIAWMAGLLYLPRLFVYHVQAGHGSEAAGYFEVMENKLLRIIMNPAMIVSWILGLLMLWADTSLFSAGWMHVKLTGIVLMTALHMVFAKWRKNLAAGTNTRSEKSLRLWNEAPAVLMVIIVIMAIVQPF